MTRKQMITACVEDQIKRGIIKAENKKDHINMRLNGRFYMSYDACLRWYSEVFNEAEKAGGVVRAYRKHE